MREEGWSIRLTPYTIYKLLNSLFLGLSIGVVFTIYEPLSPSVYSTGGVVLALATIVVARFYGKIMTLGCFFGFSLLVEIVILIMIVYFLWRPYSYMTAMLVYIGYQTTFAFGSYLVRAETLALDNDDILSRIDSVKQIGYLCGMCLSWAAYKTMESFGIMDKHDKVYTIHWMLLGVELLIILFLVRSFEKEPIVNGS